MEKHAPDAPQPESQRGHGEAPALWNPDVAGVWSIFLTPVFGSIILLRNWQSIGDEEQVKTAKTWLILSIVMLAPAFFIPFLGLVYIVVWYFAWQRHQTKYIQEVWGRNYPRKSWTKPLLIGISSILAIYLVLGILIVMFQLQP